MQRPSEYFNQLLSQTQQTQVFIAIALVLIVIMLRWIERKRKLMNIPGPFTWPILGNIPSLGDQAHIWFHNTAKRYGDVFLMKIGSIDVVVLNSMDVIQEALVRQRKVFSGRPKWKSFGFISEGKGCVFNSPETLGDQWKELKAVLVKQVYKFLSETGAQEELNKHIIREALEMIHLMRQHASSSSNTDSSSKDENYINNPTENIISIAAANVACMTVFGHRYEHDNNEFKQLISMNRVFGKAIIPCQKVDTAEWMEVIPFFKI